MDSENVLEYNLGDYSLRDGINCLADRRKYCATHSCITKDFTSEVTIWITAYNRFEKTKRCVESVLKYTSDVDYDLVLVDNGAGDETYEYFKKVDYPKKTVLHFDKNTGSAFPFTVVPIDMISNYFVLLNNDLIVTKNWLSNLLKVMKSDSRIGVVNPLSNNTSNLQCMELNYNSYEEMQEMAAKINVSDDSKWEERLRIVTLGTLVSKDCLYAMGWPFFDVGFSHNFMDDDMSFRARRAGYRLIVTRDTWICHDHPFEHEKADELTEILDRDKAKFQGKYYGIDPWNDATYSMKSIPDLLNQVKQTQKNDINILGIDPKCGMPILDIKNTFGHHRTVTTSAFFQEPKYYIDLSSICNDQVVCDREENIKCYFVENTFDYIVMGESVNVYNDPVRMIKEAYDLLAVGGQFIFPLKNTKNVLSLLSTIGYEINNEQGIYLDLTLDELNGILCGFGIEIKGVAVEYYKNISHSINELACKILQYSNKNADLNEISTRILTDKFWIIVQKN